jgi:NhaP-type Na+/H+ and K+/H+ antiporter
VAGQPLSAVGLPDGAVVMALRRHGDVLVPRGHTRLQPGDTLTLVVTPVAEGPVQRWLAEHARGIHRTSVAEAMEAGFDAAAHNVEVVDDAVGADETEAEDDASELRESAALDVAAEDDRPQSGTDGRAHGRDGAA